ncbi:MAG: protein-methionine-sulfoxide reductase catalytic subunit MsrP [Arcobacter sp.]|jgi:sulfoxide reductase catalytic subunit YedY|uniref:protein-methionine-sulfoxide reductase catalytic subunit MsrP n=1 Tax=Arcobacter sp. TaxID=1872629 RepID=UPI002A752951|nr:protein-methionine-sulfoxide reductase catalytic subunit MsrP [Arcobacter sp.]MDY3204304.1 protein-methionine-sulfoxide reductase catalytic subunit MsrP [Arcobacter sp.]
MKIIRKKSWQLNENLVTSKELFEKRRSFIKLGAATLVSSGVIIELLANEKLPTQTLTYIKDKNINNLKLNTYEQITSHNNFYEFTTKQSAVKDMAHTLKTENWKVTIDGLVEKPMEIDLDDLVKMFDIEERIYRFRCVEGWSMIVPWNGFSLSSLIKKVKPLSNAKYLRFETLVDSSSFPDQKSKMFAALDYPYVEGLRMDEAMNDLSFLAIGLYGEVMPKQNGAPIRLVVPWKYGFKSIKSIVKISFVEKEPLNTWQKMASNEYGFYANVNPNVDHPRWSQKKERVLGSFLKQNTLMFNGYENEVASLYKNMDLTKYF